MNNLTEVVFSRTLGKAEWNNSRLVKDDAPGEFLRLKGAGRDTAIFGSTNLAARTSRGWPDRRAARDGESRDPWKGHALARRQERSEAEPSQQQHDPLGQRPARA
jgi:hypothetical protein